MSEAGSARHPLDSVTGNELAQAVGILKSAGRLGDGVYVVSLELDEPDKREVLESGRVARRRASAVLLDQKGNKTYEARIDLGGGKLDYCREVARVQPMQLIVERDQAAKLVKKNPTWQEAVKKRGITDFSNVFCELWCPGEISVGHEANGARLMRVVSYARGLPIEGVLAVVDMNAGKVVDVQDLGVVTLPTNVSTDFVPAEEKTGREAARVDGAIRVEGSEIAWERWRFRYGVNTREGLVLYSVGFEDQGKVRPILYRASVAEMLEPYGDPSAGWRWKHAFCEGEYGLGKNMIPFMADRGGRLLKAEMVDEMGVVRTEANCVRMALLEGKLVIGFASRIHNFDYEFEWAFGRDGTIEFGAVVSGRPALKVVESEFCANCSKMRNAETSNPDKETRYGTLVAPNIVAPFCQHFVNVRLDFDIDGTGNSIREWDVSADESGESNPQLNAFTAQPTLLKTELKARRDLAGGGTRWWEVFNPNVRTDLGHVPGYGLIPLGEKVAPFFGANTLLRQFASFVDHALYVTVYDPGQRYAAGEFPNQARVPMGLAEYSAKDRDIANKDLVVWYTFGMTQVARPEDFPVMTPLHGGFKLVPTAFFTRNPMLSVSGDVAATVRK